MLYKTYITWAVTALLGSTAAVAQIDWIQQSPSPADVDLLGVCFITPEHGFITGADDLLMETMDGGETWAQVTSVARHPQFSEDPIWDIQFVDDLNGFAVGNTIFRTTNGGKTWQDLGSQGSMYDAKFLSPQVGYLRGNLSVLRTTNGGNSWSMVWDWMNFDGVAGIDFISESHGLLVGVRDDVPGVFRTINSGQSWERISNEPFSNVLFLTADTVVATRNAGFYRSIDGGSSWSLMYEENTEGVNGVEALRRIPGTVDSLAAIDINARIWISGDGGLTWTRTFGPLGNWGFEWDIRFADASTGYAVGRLGLVFKTIDGGMSWTQISKGAAAAINDIVMLPTGVGLAVGDRGVILRTDDFGRQWNILQQVADGPFAADLETVEAINENTIVAAGVGFIRSDDAGVTWSAPSPMPGVVKDVSFIDEETGWVFGNLDPPWGFIHRTTDGGETWTNIPQGLVTAMKEGKVMPSGRGWALFPQTEQVITDDGFFPSFTPRSLPSGESWQEFDFASDNVGWYGGFFGGVLKSTTGGYIFEVQTLPEFRHGSGANTDRLTDLVALSEQEAYIAIQKQGAIYDGVIYRTVDGGSTWSPLNPMRSDTNQFGAAISEIDVLDTGEIWAMSSNGFIFASHEPALSVPGDVDGNGAVDFADLVALLAAWGPCGIDCPGDLTGDGVVGFSDLLIVLENWNG